MQSEFTEYNHWLGQVVRKGRSRSSIKYSQPTFMNIHALSWLEYFLQRNRENDLESAPLEVELHEQKMEALGGLSAALTIAEVSIHATKGTKGCIDDLRDAKRQTQHVQNQGQQFRLIKSLLDSLPPSKKELIAPAQASLNDAQVRLPVDLQLKGKREHLNWLFNRKHDVEKELIRSDRSGNSMSIALLLALCHDIEKLGESLAHQHEDLKVTSDLHRNLMCTSRQVASSHIKERQTSYVRHWNWMTRLLGIRWGVITSKVQNQQTWKFLTRLAISLPLGFGQVFTGQLLVQNFALSLPKVALRPQNLIDANSKIIQACKRRDAEAIRGIFGAKQAHPNDRTQGDLTVVRYAVRTSDPEIVQLMLDNGADPNLPFGQFETSPLNNAFLMGNVVIIRMLLNAGADLDYQNLRSWTSLSFLWDPTRPTHSDSLEIIDICFDQGFSGWNDIDPRGWSLCHRAGAYGSGDDVRSLHHKGVNLHCYTTTHHWGPITCSVWNSNESTFDAFVDLFSKEEVVSVCDTRAWTLLHFAAQNGCRHILTRLLDIGADPHALTIKTSDWVTKNLDWKRLTAETIAREYGHGDLWDELMRKEK